MTLASFFGAMLEVNYLDISCNGFSHQTVLLNQAEVILMAITVILNILD
jgi:hypothetical protein